MTEIAHYIDNVPVAGSSGRSLPVFDPATGETKNTVALASSVEAERSCLRSQCLADLVKNSTAASRPHSGSIQDDLMGSSRSTCRSYLR